MAYAYRSHVATPTPVVSVIRLSPSSVVDFLVKLAADPLGRGDELGLLDHFVHTKCSLNIGADLLGGVPVDAVRGAGGQMIQQVVDPSKTVLCLTPPLLLFAGAQECQTEIKFREGIVFVDGQSLFERLTSFRKIANLVIGLAQVGP